MDPVAQAFFGHFENLHREIEKVLDGLPSEALDWVPVPEQNSIGALAFHAAGAERYWVWQIIGAQNLQRDREAEFHTRGVDAAALKARLAETLAGTRRVMESLSAAD